jgi:hypothetical protein
MFSSLASTQCGFQPHEQLYRSLRERKISFNVHKEYDAPGIFIGASLSLNASNSASLSLVVLTAC